LGKGLVDLNRLKVNYLIQIIIILLFSVNSFSQLNCHIKLIDTYSSKEISLDNSFILSKSNYTIDSNNNFIIVSKAKGKKVNIKSEKFNDINTKINLKRRKNDTIVLRLTPNSSTVKSTLKKLWNDSSKNKDTLIFENYDEATSYIMTYLKYLSGLQDKCNVSLCNYNNTYRYYLLFKQEKNQIYKLNQINKLQPEKGCKELDSYLEQLKFILPHIRIKKEELPFKVYFSMLIPSKN
jgi:hypothetical protein